jgi:DNA-binding NarL/FixJ family response regulator
LTKVNDRNKSKQVISMFHLTQATLVRAKKAVKPRVVLADDEEALLRLISRFLGPTFDIVASARNGREAVSLVLQLQPDLLVLDIGLPVMHGLDVLAILKQKRSPTKVVFLSTFADRHLSAAALSAGATGFVFKAQVYTDLPQALDAVVAGRTFVSKEEVK